MHPPQPRSNLQLVHLLQKTTHTTNLKYLQISGSLARQQQIPPTRHNIEAPRYRLTGNLLQQRQLVTTTTDAKHRQRIRATIRNKQVLTIRMHPNLSGAVLAPEVVRNR